MCIVMLCLVENLTAVVDSLWRSRVNRYILTDRWRGVASVAWGEPHAAKMQ